MGSIQRHGGEVAIRQMGGQVGEKEGDGRVKAPTRILYMDVELVMREMVLGRVEVGVA